MSEYIVDDELVQGIISEAYRKGKGGAEVWTQREWRQEPIVRCKDCKWHGEDEQTGIVYYCKWWGRCVETEPNGFCAWGER